jgi:hypothetical protein
MAEQNTPSQILSARYVAIRTAEARGLTDRLLEAARDRTPGLRSMLVPLLYRFWYRSRDEGWALLEQIGDDVISRRFPNLIDNYAVETFAEFSLAVLNTSRHDPSQLERLAGIWRVRVERIFATPLARLLGQGLVLRVMARPVTRVLARQPAFQPLNLRELRATFAQPDDFRQIWRNILVCLEQPENGYGQIAELLMQKDRPYDLYVMLLCERTLIYHGVARDAEGVITLLERVFAEGNASFRQSVIYILFHILTNLPKVEDSWLNRYVAICEEFFTSNSWRMTTSAGEYNFGSHLCWPEVAVDQNRPGSEPRVIPQLLARAVDAGDEAQIDGLFAAIDSIAFAYSRAGLALNLLERALQLGGPAFEDRVLKSLATVRLQNQPLVDAFIEQHRNLANLRERLEGIEASIRENDMPTLLDGLTVQLILSSSYFRGRVCDAFRRAIDAHSVPQFLVQILEWLRDEFRRMKPATR